MKTVTDFPRKTICIEDQAIIMPDGTRLSARIWMPEDAAENPVPVILEHLPYRKRDGTTARDSLTHPWLAGHGYACIRTDMRGNGDSDGLMEDEYTAQELQDACDVLAWAAEQPWSTGSAGMMGISWGGFNALQVAALQPPSLKAIITLCSTVDRFADDIHTKGGCQLGENLGWAANMLAYSSRPPDPAIVGDRWREMWLERLEAMPFLLSTWLRHQRRDEYWKHGSVCEDYSAIKVPVLSIGGWHDGYRNTISHLVSNVEAPVKGIVGPWIHKYPHYAAPGPAIGFLQEARRWWDHWLKGEDTGVERDPAMRLWLMDPVKPAMWHDERPGRWIANETWPSASHSTRMLHLSGNLLAQDPGPVSRIVDSPADCGSATGEYFPFTFGAELPGEQRVDDARSVVFDHDGFDAVTDIVGAAKIHLRIVPQMPFGQIAVRLCDVDETGSSALITMGVLNLTHWKNHENPQPLVPGEAIDVVLDLDQIAYRLMPGRKLRIAVSNAYWPFVWPAPGKAPFTIEGGSIALPVRPTATGNEWHFEKPEGASPWNIAMRRKAHSSRRQETDMATGETTIIIENDFGITEDLDHGLWQEAVSVERWTIHPDDPLCASAHILWTKRMGRGDWQIEAKSSCAMRADAENFQIRANLSASENGQPVFERQYDDSIARDMV